MVRRCDQRVRHGGSRRAAAAVLTTVAVGLAGLAAEPASNDPWRSAPSNAAKPTPPQPAPRVSPLVAQPVPVANDPWRSTSTPSPSPVRPADHRDASGGGLRPASEGLGPLPRVPAPPDSRFAPPPLQAPVPLADPPPSMLIAPVPRAVPAAGTPALTPAPVPVPTFTRPPVAFQPPAPVTPPAGPPTFTIPPPVQAQSDPPSVALPPPRSFVPPGRTNIALTQPVPTEPALPSVGQPGSEQLPLPRPSTLSATPELDPVPTDKDPNDAAPAAKDPNQPKPSAVVLASARNAVRAGDFALAATRFEEYLRLVPKDLAVREEYGGVLFQADRVAEAALVFEEVIRTDPIRAPRLLLVLSDLAVRTREYAKACARLNEALALTASDEKKYKQLRLDAAARLAQLNLGEDQYPKAVETFDRYFAGLRPGEENLPPRMASLLIDLQRPKEALAFLVPMLEAFPDNAELLTAQVRAYAMLGDRTRTTEALGILSTKLPQNADARQELGSSLIGTEDYDLAAVVLAQGLSIRPTNVALQITQAELYLRQFRLTQARVTLDGVRPASPLQERDLLLTKGAWHIAAGEYTQAKLLYEGLLRKDPFDYDARLSLGNTHSFARELERAKAEFCKIPPGVRQWRPARRAYATALAQQRKFKPALDTLEELHREAPWDAQTVALYARISDQSGSPDRAAEVANGYLQSPPTKSAEATVRAALGRVLLDANKGVDAEHQFNCALQLSDKKSILAVYGLTKIGYLFNDPARFPTAFMGDRPLDELRYRIVMSDYFAEDRDNEHSLEYAQAALRLDPQNLAALSRAADGELRMARQSGNITEAAQAAKTVLTLSPVNFRGFLTLARAYSIGQNYQAAATTYHKLISADGDAVLPKRELARVLYADHKYDLSHDTYSSIAAAADPESAFRQTLSSMASKMPANVRPGLDGLAGGKLSPLELKAEVRKMAAGCNDPLLAAGLQAAAADYEARQAEARGAELEDRAKMAKGIRDLNAIPSYRELIGFEPDNTDAMFDLGQIYSSRQMTRAAVSQYGQLLSADPEHREAMIASNRARAEDSPTYRANLRYENEFGRNGVVNISRLRMGQLFTTPIGDENEFLGVGYTRAEYYPGGAPNLSGNIPTFVAQKKVGYSDNLLFRSQLNVEAYQNRFSTRPTFDTGFLYNGNGFRGEVATYLENVVQNAESLNQDIYRYGGRLAGDYQVNRRLDVGGLFRYGYYSDVNNMYETQSHAAYLLCFAPTQLRFILNVQTLSYAKQTVFGPAHDFNQTDLTGTIHPYFAPSGFTYYEGRLDFTHYLGRDYFAHANTCWYNLQYGVGVDNEFNSYNQFRAAANWDVKPWMTIGIDGRYTYSPVYRYGSIYMYFILRMPFMCRF